MGFLKDRSDGKEIDHENDPTKREEDYEKMYMKIGRDFLHKDDFARIRGPVGLDIGAVSPAEIAISIVAQITETLHRP